MGFFIELVSRLKVEEGTGPVQFSSGNLLPYMDCCGQFYRRCKGLFGAEHTPGKLTIGYGINIEDTGVTVQEADFLLVSRVDALAPILQSRISNWNSLSDARKVVLLDLAYEFGASRLLTEFRPTIDLVLAGRFEEAASHMRGWSWYQQVGKRAEPLCLMMEKGEVVEPTR